MGTDKDQGGKKILHLDLRLQMPQKLLRANAFLKFHSFHLLDFFGHF